MGRPKNSNDGVDTQEPSGVDEEQGAAATTPEPPVDPQDDQGQAIVGAGVKTSGEIDDEVIPEENLDPDGLDTENDQYPNRYLSADVTDGHIVYYGASRFPAHACVACGRKHAPGQFDDCEGCGTSISTHRGNAIDGAIVAV
jgi:hypothetical protein